MNGPFTPQTEAPRRNRDLGLQPERTGLAWSRTALAMLVTALLQIRMSLTADSVVLACGAILPIATAAVMALRGNRRQNADLQGRKVVTPASLQLIRAVTASGMTIALLALGIKLAEILSGT